MMRFDVGSRRMKLTEENKPAYSKWVNILERCYSKKHKSYKYYGGSGVTVCKEWLIFDNFYEWFKANYKGGYHIDKDLKLNPKKEYSPETCLYVSREVNNMFVTNRNIKTKPALPVGVHEHISGGFYSSISLDNTKVYLTGKTYDMNKAALAYLTAKREAVKAILKTVECKVTKTAIEYQIHLLTLDINVYAEIRKEYS